MRCAGCGYESRDQLETCKLCGAPMVATATAAPAGAMDEDLSALRLEPERGTPGRRGQARIRAGGVRARRGGSAEPLVEMLDDDAIEIKEDDLIGGLIVGPTREMDDGGPPFKIDDDLFPAAAAGSAAVASPVSEPEAWEELGVRWQAPGEDLPEPDFALSPEEPPREAHADPIIERCDEVPERCWAPEIAGFGRRTLALLVDQSLLAAVLSVFLLGACLALQLSGLDTDLLLAAPGLQAVALPFALLLAGLSFAYYAYFHGSTGCTPGKALAGIAVRTGSGGAPPWDKVLLRWFGALLALACAGIGIFWALFEPRRRGWADLLSGTVIARRRR